MADYKLKDIAIKYLEGRTTKEEEAWLHNYYNNVDNEPEETVIVDSGITEDDFGKEMFALLKQKIASKEIPVVPMRRKIWTRIAVAASVLIVTGYVLWVTVSKKDSIAPTEVAKIAQTDIAPGKNGAVLTMADGRQIVLDDLKDGVVSKEENTEVVKQQNVLQYTNNKNGNETAYNTLTTPKGRQFQLVLSDGSKVWLNAASSITYPTVFVGKERKVTISGEAYFEVAHDASKPFIVSKGETSVQVLGTHFNVNAYDDGDALSVTLLEGSVAVKSRLSGTGSEASEVRIKPGEQAIVASGKLQVANGVDTEEVMAWKNGLFAFHDANIEDIMKEVARWYDAEIVYEGDIKNEYFSGTAPRSSNASLLLKVLETTNTVRFEIQDGKIIVRPVK